MRDDELDALYEAIFDELIEILGRNAEGDQATAERAAGLLWIARHLARIGDHATNVAERVYFMVVGERLKPIIEAKKKSLAAARA